MSFFDLFVTIANKKLTRIGNQKQIKVLKSLQIIVNADN